MTPAILSVIVLAVTLALFAWGKLRHDLVALVALAACLLLGLVPMDGAFAGFSDSSVIVIAAVLIIGRAVELTGVADAATDRLAALNAPFAVQLAIVCVIGAGLSAFMNNIAALAITMPAVIGICRSAGLPPGAGLMPLSFATILGGMTTLIGTPANLILSSVRESQLGAPFGFFDMTPAATAVAAIGILYICLIGWRLAPMRAGKDAAQKGAYAVFELGPFTGPDLEQRTEEERLEALKGAGAAALGIIRTGRLLELAQATPWRPGDRILASSTNDPWEVAKKAGVALDAPQSDAKDVASVFVVVGHGSPLIGRPFDTTLLDTNGEVAVIAAGARAAQMRAPLDRLRIEAGDQLTLYGSADAIATYARYARLIEVARRPIIRVDRARALLVLGAYAAAVLAAVIFGAPTALTFTAAAALVAAFGLLPYREIYSSVDWSIIVLIGAMIPVGESFQTSGAAALAANALSDMLGAATLFWAAAAIATVTMLLSIFLNNVATAIIMGQIAINVAAAIGAPPDALLIAVLIGASSDFLTPIGHQNNLLVMGPGGYRFLDYARVGLPLAILVVLTAAFMISRIYA